MDVSNLNINNELIDNSELIEDEKIYHVVIDKSIWDYFLELVFFVIRCLIICFIPVIVYYFFKYDNNYWWLPSWVELLTDYIDYKTINELKKDNCWY